MRRERVRPVPSRQVAIAAVAAVVIVALGPRPRLLKVDRLLEQAAAAFTSGQPSAALRALSQAIALNPALASLHPVAARLALQAGDPSSALDHIAEARRNGAPPERLACLALEASVLSPLTSPPLAELSSDCLHGSQAPRVWLEMILRRGDVEIARGAFDLWVSAHPEDAWGWERLAALTALGDSNAAEEVMLRALAASPEGSPLLDGLWSIVRRPGAGTVPAETAALVGELAASTGDWLLASIALEVAVELDPGLARARAYLGMAQTLRGRDGLAHLRRAAAEAPTDPLVRSLLGQYWLRRGMLPQALGELSAASRLDPTNPAIAAAHGAALARSGLFPEAAQAYLAAAEADRYQPDFWLLLAEFSLLYDYQVETLGLPAARNAAALDPHSPAALSALGFASHLGGDSSVGERLIRHSLSLDPLDPTSWYRLGLILLEAGRAEDAGGALRTALRLDPDGRVGRLAGRTLESLP